MQEFIDAAKLKLTETSRILLEEDPVAFLNSYGYGFIGMIASGGTFTGTINL